MNTRSKQHERERIQRYAEAADGWRQFAMRLLDKNRELSAQLAAVNSGGRDEVERIRTWANQQMFGFNASFARVVAERDDLRDKLAFARERIRELEVQRADDAQTALDVMRETAED